MCMRRRKAIACTFAMHSRLLMWGACPPADYVMAGRMRHGLCLTRSTKRPEAVTWSCSLARGITTVQDLVFYHSFFCIEPLTLIRRSRAAPERRAGATW